jgi:UDP-2-acetamido-2-deoxy-ribo-hexuluronate aminotransferase
VKRRNVLLDIDAAEQVILGGIDYELRAPFCFWCYAGHAERLAERLSAKGRTIDSQHAGWNWLSAIASDFQTALSSNESLSAGHPVGETHGCWSLEKIAQRLGADTVVVTQRPIQWLHTAVSLEQLAPFAPAEEIELLDLTMQQDQLRAEIERRIDATLQHGRYIMGPEITELETALADRLATPHCITVASGTDAILIALMALGIGPGDEVITTPYTWIATAETIALLQARPVFVDIDPQTFNLDPAKLERAITAKTRAIMPVSLYGQCAELNEINRIAAAHGLPVIEDAAQSFGATHHGQPSCTLTTIGITSFFPTKPLGCYGDGGAIFTRDDEMADRMRRIRLHGASRKHHHTDVGINGRLDTLQAAILLAKLPRFTLECEQRRQVAAKYAELLTPISREHAPSGLELPFISEHNESVFAQYTILSDQRDKLHDHLHEQRIQSCAYYQIPLYRQPVFSDLGYQPEQFEQTEWVAARCLSLPMSPWLTIPDQQRIAECIHHFFQTANRLTQHG